MEVTQLANPAIAALGERQTIWKAIAYGLTVGR